LPWWKSSAQVSPGRSSDPDGHLIEVGQTI
jgi:hypothetical protein